MIYNKWVSRSIINSYSAMMYVICEQCSSRSDGSSAHSGMRAALFAQLKNRVMLTGSVTLGSDCAITQAYLELHCLYVTCDKILPVTG